MHMQDTIKMEFTPESLAIRLDKKYPSLQRTLNRLDISCEKKQPLKTADLVKVLQQESTPHHTKSPDTVQIAGELLNMISKGQTIPDNSHQADEDSRPKAGSIAINRDATDKNEEDKDSKQAESSAKDNEWTAMSVFRFLFVAGLIALQAWMYTGLAMEVINHEEHSLPIAALFLGGVLIEAAGIMIAADMKLGAPVQKYRNGRKVMITPGKAMRSAWLWIFFFFQVGVDAAYVNVFEYASGVELLGKALIVISIPGGILAYSHIYLNQKDNA